jgi:hypothetical protein
MINFFPQYCKYFTYIAVITRILEIYKNSTKMWKLATNLLNLNNLGKNRQNPLKLRRIEQN